MRIATILTICVAVFTSCKEECNHPEPVAKFSVTAESFPVNSTVEFTNASTDATSYIWDFGNGETSIDENPKYNYTKPGNYKVRLTAAGNGGVSMAELTLSITFEVGITDGYSIDGNLITDTWDETRSKLGDNWLYTEPQVDGGEYYHTRIYDKEGIVFYYTTFNDTVMGDEIPWGISVIAPYNKYTEKGVGIGSSTMYGMEKYGVPEISRAGTGAYFGYLTEGVVFYYSDNKVNEILILEPEGASQSKREKSIINKIIDKRIAK
ncbi:MAG: PKD domain-containing protein [Bacteroidales bacterium]|nr:PKD domain-containing protein [Bacteroidales bacterium]